jgi:hypothetical protein
MNFDQISLYKKAAENASLPTVSIETN